MKDMSQAFNFGNSMVDDGWVHWTIRLLMLTALAVSNKKLSSLNINVGDESMSQFQRKLKRSCQIYRSALKDENMS